MQTAREKLTRIAVKVNGKACNQPPQNKLAAVIERFFYRHQNKLVLVHAAMFCLFLGLILIPLLTPPPPESANIFSNFTLFAQFLLWGVWFPLVFASVLLTGRSWCGLFCPMGAASEWTTRIGMGFKIPGWLKWEGTPIFSFLVVTILGQTVDVRDQATAIAEVFGGMLILALLVGFFYGKQTKRAWCRHVCPIGLLLGMFSRLGIVQFSPKLPRAGGDQYTEKGMCPTMISINHKQESRHCIECFRCVNPAAKGGLFLRFRKLGEEIIHIRTNSPSMGEVWFIFLSTGIALGGFLWLILPSYQTFRQNMGEWFINHGWDGIGNSGPAWLMSVHPEWRQAYNWLDFITIIGFMLGSMLFTCSLLSICTLASSYLAGKLGADGTLKKRFIELGYQFAPVAMISIIIGLGDTLFTTLHASALKGALLMGSIFWSVYLGNRLLSKQGVQGTKRGLALIPGFLGSLLIGLAWWPAVVGINFSLLEQYRQHLIILS